MASYSLKLSTKNCGQTAADGYYRYYGQLKIDAALDHNKSATS